MISKRKSVFGVFNTWIDLIFPPLCANCKEFCRTLFFCPSCWELCSPPDPFDRCRHCFLELEGESSLCPQCQSEPHLIAPYACVFHSTDAARRLCLEKKERSEAIAAFIMNQWIRLDWPTPQWVIPMPRAKALVKHFSSWLSVPYVDILSVCQGSWECAVEKVEEDQILLLIDLQSTFVELEKALDALIRAFPKRIYVLSLSHYDSSSHY